MTRQRNYFYVYQNKTFEEEYAGRFLWSPQYAKGGKKNAGYETMKQVRAGDVILHSYRRKIVAIGLAETNCYASPRPSSAFNEWDNEGWRIDVSYYLLSQPLDVMPYIEELYKMQPLNGPFAADLRGRLQYLCNANKELFDFLINKIVYAQQDPYMSHSLLCFLCEKNCAK